MAAAGAQGESKTYLVVPLAGPWITLGVRNCSPRDPCDLQALGGALLVLDGALQALGVGLLVTAFFVPEKEPGPPVGMSTAHVTVAPVKLGTSGYGLSAEGRF
jgi:hypothetical protein